MSKSGSLSCRKLFPVSSVRRSFCNSSVTCLSVTGFLRLLIQRPCNLLYKPVKSRAVRLIAEAAENKGNHHIVRHSSFPFWVTVPSHGAWQFPPDTRQAH